MAHTQFCPRCGLPLAEGVAEGLCRRCLLEAGLGDTLTTEHRTTPASLGNAPAALSDFGPYHTIGVLGEGGMGIVYLAEQHEPVRRRVALKVLKSGDAGSQVLARFASESQALALMDHPNIARIYDAGTTASGRPYFAMEYVPGIPITDYCDRNLLGFHERLTLFQQVCQAVHHAHQKGVIHRDLKPSNVLVMLQDGVPVPKVIDFGVAKAVNQRLTERTLFTEIGMLIGTPEYMSPEQADLTGLDIDSTTDVYSLGVLLYELLVGALPFDSKSLRKAGFAEIQRVIRETEPPKPSTRLSTMGEAAQEAARHRRSDVRTMARLLRGDLEWITMKALEKDRTRRYASASEFAADIARHLGNEPVLAGPHGFGYRTRKFVGRHKGLVAAGSAVALALLIGAVVSFVLYLKAAREQERAESESYTANLTAADVQLRAGQVSDARSRLANAVPALRGWEWRYLMARTDESSATIYARDASEMELSEDGERVFSYGETSLRSWDVLTKRLVMDRPGFGRVLAVGAAGKTILVGPLQTTEADPLPEGIVLRLYDVETRRLLKEFRGMPGNPYTAAVNRAGTVVAAVQRDSRGRTFQPSGPITVWNAKTGEVMSRLEGHPAAVLILRLSPDGKLLASSSYDHTVQLWDLISHQKAATLNIQWPSSIGFSNDGRLLATGTGSGTVQIWNPANGLKLRGWQASPSGTIGAVAFSSDGLLLATCSGETIRVWDAISGELRSEFNGHQEVLEMAFHPMAPKLYSAGGGVIKEWDLSRVRTVLQEEVMKVAFSPDNRYIVVGAMDRIGRIFDANSARLVRSLTGHIGRVITVAFSPDSMLAASGSSGENSIKVWSVPTGRLVRTFAGHTEFIWSVAFSPDGSRIVSGSEDQTIRTWDLASQAPPQVISTTSPITQVAFSPDGHTNLALRKYDKLISLWDAVTKQQSGILNSATLELDPTWPRAMGLSQDGEVLIGPADSGRAIAIWDFPKRRLKQVLPVLHGSDQIASLAISPDGSRAAIGDADLGNISIWDLRRGSMLVTLGGHSGVVYSLAWSPDGTRLVSTGGNMIHFWDSRSDHNYDAELLLDKLSARCLLADEAVQQLETDRTLSTELRREAIQLATKRGSASYVDLIEAAWTTGVASNLPSSEYTKGLNRATAAVKLVPGHGRSQMTFALLQFRPEQFEPALLSARRAIEIQKSQSVDAYAIRAMAYYRLHDTARARSEAAMARQSANQSGVNGDHSLLQEAEALVGK